MFEGLVRQLILGYLGRYIKDIQKEQLKITLWNEEVLLENVELILEAFDYLQLPFALKQGRVGRLSIKIPWKKLGWDPIIITIEDVFVSACQRDDHEWSADAVERREFSAKRAKLAAAELAKLSRRVCENQAGQSFVSYITAKILEGIQVSIRNVHVLYRDMLTNMEQTVIGLRFSSLSIMKQNFSRFSAGKVKSGQVNKIVEIHGLEIYCSTSRKTLDLVKVTNVEGSKLSGYAEFEGNSDLYLLAPVDISMSLMVNRSGSSRNDAPQFSVNIELTELVMSLSDYQLGQILTLWEYLCICKLRKIYGRYRPWDKPLSRKYLGWQVAWWHYAQQSVLSDVRRKLKKNSWKYFGQRLNCRRKYVNLYKTKLKNLREEQIIDDDVLQQLEQIEKESDLEDILNYRGIAESELQDFLDPENSSFEANGVNVNPEKPSVNERVPTRPRGWLNWLSRGMLGAGGTDDSSQFSGVISDEVIKDIYEATKFKPTSSPDGSTFVADVFFSELNFLVHKVSTTLWIRDYGQAASKLILEELIIECKLWEDTLVMSSSVNNARIINEGNKQNILLIGKAALKKDVLDIDKPAICIQVDSSSAKQDVKFLVEVTEPLEVTYDSEFLRNIMEFHHVLKTFKSHHERVMLSLNEFEDVRARLLWKAEYTLSTRQRVVLDVSFGTIKINVMSRNAMSLSSDLVLQIGSLHFTTIGECESASDFEDEFNINENLKSSISTSDISTKIELQHLYDHFELQITDLEMKVLIPSHNQITVVEKMSASLSVTSCIIPDESILLQQKVNVSIQSLCAHFSPTIHLVVLRLLDNENRLHSDLDCEPLKKERAPGIKSKGVTSPKTVCCAIVLNLQLVSLHVDLENDKEIDCNLMISLEEVNIRYDLRELQECRVSSRTLRIISYSTDSNNESLVLCSSGNPFSGQYAKQQETAVDHNNGRGTCSDENTYSGQCFILQYEECKNVSRTFHKLRILLTDIDSHCYPYIIRLLVEFSEKIISPGAFNTVESSFTESPVPVNCFGFEKFGFSNLSETGSADCNCISVDNFPFVTVDNVSSHSKGKSSFIQPISGWRNKLKLRESQIRSPELSARELRRSHVSHSKPRPRKDEMALSNNWDTDLLIDLNVNRIRVHFHDSSSIVATVSLSISRSLITSGGDFLDMLFSIEGLSLCSSWWNSNIQETMWDPLENISPILNLRVLKYQDGPLRSHCRISFSIQHVSCILLPEFLAVIIGYFSLSDWYAEENNSEIENCTTISYVFEIVDSAIFAPAEECDSQVLKLVIPHFYGSFVDSCSDNVLKDIPSECSVAENKIAKRNQCLNLYGWDLSLSLLLSNRDELGISLVGQKSGDVYETFIASFSADLWVLIPTESGVSTGSSASTCVMARIHDCQMIVKGGYIFSGFEALLKITDQFSSVGIESKCFKTDIVQFRHFNKNMKDNGTFLSEEIMVLVDTRCCVNLMSIHFYQSSADAVSSEQIARADTKFVFCASFINEIIQFLDVSFCRLALFSKLNSVILAECTSSSPMSSVLDIGLSMSDEGKREYLISLPYLDIWLHLFDWTVVINLFESYTELAKTSFNGGSHVKLSLGPADQNEDTIVKAIDYFSMSSSKRSCSSPETMEQKAILILKSESLGIKVYIPVLDSREPFSKYGEAQVQGEKYYVGSFKDGKKVSYNFITISLQSRCSELIVDGDRARIRLHIGKINGALEMFKGKTFAKSSTTLPIFQFSRVNIEGEILNKPSDRLHTLLAVQCDSLELWLSYQIFYFLKCISFKSSGSVSAQSTLSSIDLNMKLKKISILLTDGRWSSKAPLLEALVRNFIFNFIFSGLKLECSISGEVQVNYNNIRKVLWEPFVEPWKFQLNINRLHDEGALLDNAGKTTIHLNSTEQLNLNITDSFVEVVFRAIEMVKDALGFLDQKVLPGSQGLLYSPICEQAHNGKYAPYILQNLTSLPLLFNVCKGPQCARNRKDSDLKDGTFVSPGALHPIYINGTPEEQLLHHRPAYSSERLSDKQLNGTAHNYVIIQFEGTVLPSTPISMDLVGLSYFEVDFSKSSYKREVNDVIGSSKSTKPVDENNQAGSRSGFVVPVVCDVSVQQYCKLVRFYSTVILFNGTSVPIEVRFDIPFGLSPKILDPVHPGQEFPLPLHLAEAGRVRWRPLGQNVLWSEAHNLSNIISNESRIGLLRSFVCYPSRPNSDPFRCCIAVQQISFPQSVEKRDQKLHKEGRSEKYLIHQVTLSSPLVVRNFLPKNLSLALDCGGITRTALLTEVESFFYHVDSSHDLEITFNLHGFGPASLKFPRTETFCAIAKVAATKFCQSETITFNPDFGDGLLYVSVEKTMDAFYGAREICIYVPYLLYNCTSFPLLISDSTTEEKGNSFLVPSCYDFGERDQHMGMKDGLGLLSSDLDFLVATPHHVNLKSSSKIHNVSGKSSASFPGLIVRNPTKSVNSIRSQESSSGCDLSSRTKSNLGNSNMEAESSTLQACMYAPDPNSLTSERVVRVRRSIPEGFEHMPKSSWSSPFFLVQPAGSTTVSVPHISSNAADVISVTSSAVAGHFSGKTRVITFQPRYVISNACSKDLYYKQKGTDSNLHLGVGQHCHLQWTDTLRELLLSVRFGELGWQWSGCFSPNNLGDTQVKMRNYVNGSVSMIRVEVQNADYSIRDEKIVGSLQGNSGTNLILLSDDDTGFMPYRIDNFSKERLRVYQQSCQTFETIIQSYTSCPFAWDEPCCPHRLTVEVPGQRILGSYTLDHVKDYVPVHLSSTSEKPERTLVVSVHAEGAVKVLSVIDSSYHVLNDRNNMNLPRIREKRKHDQKEEVSNDFNEKISVYISFIGISLMNSYPQELIFASAKKTRIDLLQSPDQQKFSLQIECLQIDNQLQSTPYPVILSFNRGHRSSVMGQTRKRADNAKMKNDSVMLNTSDRLCELDFCLSAAKWRNKDASLVSFEYISLRIADFHLQVDQEILLGLLDFYRATLSRSQLEASLTYGMGFRKDPSQGYIQSNGEQFRLTDETQISRSGKGGHLQPSIVPIGAPWQQIYLLARRQKKVYIEMFDLSPIKLTLSFSSTPWMLRNALLASGESVIHRGLVALADIEGAQIYLGQLNVTHHMASWDSIQDIIIKHYTRQLLQEMYKVFGSAGVIGNPMGFARSVSLGIKDFVSAPARNLLKSPAGLITGMAQGTSSLLSNTVYALSDAATQFSRAAHKGIVAFTFDDQAVAGMEKHQKGVSLHNKGVVDEILEGLTGLLQSPIRGAEKHGLLGVLSGVAMGMTELVARPAASILDATGKTAQSIRNRSKLHQLGHHGLRVRLPRPLNRDLPLRPYSWEEAIGTTVLSDANDGKFKEENLILCKMLKQGGKLVIITRKLVLIINCSSLVDLGKPEFQGVPVDPEWVIETEIGLESVIHADTSEGVVHIVGSNLDPLVRYNQNPRIGSEVRVKRRWNNYNPINTDTLPLFQSDLEFTSQGEADKFLQILLSAVEEGKVHGWGNVYVLHQSNLK